MPRTLTTSESLLDPEAAFRLAVTTGGVGSGSVESSGGNTGADWLSTLPAGGAVTLPWLGNGGTVGASPAGGGGERKTVDTGIWGGGGKGGAGASIACNSAS